MILPKLDYCDFTWNDNLSATINNSLERIQTKAVRLILKEGNLSHD